MVDYIFVHPTRIGWIRLSPTIWLDNQGKRITLSFGAPLVHVPINYQDLDR